MMDECMIDPDEEYVRPKAIHVRNVALIMEAIQLPNGKMSMIFHHFDPRELPIVALNRERNFFLAKNLVIDGRNHFSTDLERILT